jgi:transcriptional regulator with XRE-family HTH domain
MIRSRIDGRESFGDRLRLSRGRMRAGGQKLTQAGLARAVGVERNTVSRWENGGMLPKDPAVIASLARVLDVTADWLISGAPPEARELPATKLHEGTRGQYVDPAIAELPARARTLAAAYLDRLRGAGCSPVQLGGAASLLLAGARNRVAAKPLEKRDDDQVCADVDAAWDLVVHILRRDGIRL